MNNKRPESPSNFDEVRKSSESTSLEYDVQSETNAQAVNESVAFSSKSESSDSPSLEDRLRIAQGRKNSETSNAGVTREISSAQKKTVRQYLKQLKILLKRKSNNFHWDKQSLAELKDECQKSSFAA